jgi:hypothetical protein
MVSRCPYLACGLSLIRGLCCPTCFQPLVVNHSLLSTCYHLITRTTPASAALHSQQPTYELDPAALEKRYKLLQWQLHPDKSAGKTPEERQYSADQATLINQAYGVLRNPLSRANYMVRHGTSLRPRGISAAYVCIRGSSTCCGKWWRACCPCACAPEKTQQLWDSHWHKNQRQVLLMRQHQLGIAHPSCCNVGSCC